MTDWICTQISLRLAGFALTGSAENRRWPWWVSPSSAVCDLLLQPVTVIEPSGPHPPANGALTDPMLAYQQRYKFEGRLGETNHRVDDVCTEITKSIAKPDESMESISQPFCPLRWAIIKPERRLKATILGRYTKLNLYNTEVQV